MDMQMELSDGININSIAQAIADFLRDERIQDAAVIKDLK